MIIYVFFFALLLIFLALGSSLILYSGLVILIVSWFRDFHR